MTGFSRPFIRFYRNVTGVVYIIHYMLAKYYSGSESGDSGASEKRFLVANHYSKVFGMIDSPMEKKHIAQILLKGAQAACLLSTYEIALGYTYGSAEPADVSESFGIF